MFSAYSFHTLTSHSLPAHSNLARPLHSWKMLFRCPWTSTALVFTAPSPRHLSPGLCRPTPVPPCSLATLQTSLQAPPLLLGPLTSPVPQNVDLYRLLPSHGLWSLHDADRILEPVLWALSAFQPVPARCLMDDHGQPVHCHCAPEPRLFQPSRRSSWDGQVYPHID